MCGCHFVELLCWLAFVLATCSISEASAPDLPSLSVTASSHYDLGEKIGQKFKDEIRTAISANTFFEKTVLLNNQSEAGASMYNSLLAAAKESFPQYVDEVRGMADGAELDFSVLFLWNARMEMELLLESEEVPTPSCSDLYIRSGKADGTFMAHNEDGDKSFMPTSYLVNAEVLSKDAHMPLENFTAFCYPGELCGCAFGFSPSISLIFAVNAVFPKTVNTSAIARNFLNRALITMPYNQIPNFLREQPCASGFSLNMGDLSTGRLSNVEVSPSSVVHTEYEANSTGYHFNMYIHSPGVDQKMDPSSMHRQQRVKQMPTPSTAMDLKKILGDTKDKEYPIFRTATPPDSAMTLATGVFDFSSKQMYVYRGNPASQSPSAILPM